MRSRGLLARMREHRPYASPAERNVIDYLLGHAEEAASQSVRELSESTFVSPSTVVRFCRRFGCSGYREFQRELVHELAHIDPELDIAMECVSPDDSTADVVHKVVRSNVRSVEATEHLIDLDALDAAAEAIRTSRVTNLFGIGASLLVAHDLEMKLTRVGKECHIYDDWHSQLLCAKNMRPTDVAVVVSYSGMTSEALTCARTARGRGARVVAITRTSVDSPLASVADWTLGVAASEPLIRSGAMASRLSQLTVVDMLYAVYVSRDYERCTSVMRQNYIEKDGTQQ